MTSEEEKAKKPVDLDSEVNGDVGFSIF